MEVYFPTATEVQTFTKTTEKGRNFHGKVDFCQNRIVEKVWKLLKTGWKETHYTVKPHTE